jgi:hypothetical protein
MSSPLHRGAHIQQAAFDHADRHKARLSVTVTVIRPFDGKDVTENITCCFEGNAMLAASLTAPIL